MSTVTVSETKSGKREVYSGVEAGVVADYPKTWAACLARRLERSGKMWHWYAVK